MENDITDALSEVRNVAAEAAVEERALFDVEREVADTMRQICKDLFDGTTQYRLKTTDLGNVPVYQHIGIVLERAPEGQKQLRVTTNGRFVTAWVTASSGNLDEVLDHPEWNEGDLYLCPEPSDSDGSVTLCVGNDEIADHAVELAQQLIDVLKRRIDTAKDHRATLARVRDAMAGDA